MKANIVTLPGDYIGPEIIAQAVKVLEAVAAKYGHEFYFDERKLGGASIDAFGVPLTDETLAACNAADAVLMGSVGGPKWTRSNPPAAGKRAARPAQRHAGVRQSAPLHDSSAALRRVPAPRGHHCQAD